MGHHDFDRFAKPANQMVLDDIFNFVSTCLGRFPKIMRQNDCFGCHGVDVTRDIVIKAAGVRWIVNVKYARSVFAIPSCCVGMACSLYEHHALSGSLGFSI